MQHSEVVNSAVFSPDGSQILTTSNDDTAKLWDAPTGRLRIPPLQHSSDVRRYAAFSNDGRWVATGSDDNTARVWSTAPGETIMTRLVHNGTVYCTAFSPISLLLATASDDNTVRVWNLASLHATAAVDPAPATAASKQVAIPLDVAAPPLPPVRDLRAEGNRVLGTNRLTGTAIDLELQLPGSQEQKFLPLDFADLSPDGLLIATIQERQQVACVWNAKTGAPKTPPLRHTGMITNLGFGSAGDRLVTCSSDNMARMEHSGRPPSHRRCVIGNGSRCDLQPGWNEGRHCQQRSDGGYGTPLQANRSPALVHSHSVEQAFFSADGKSITTRR